MTSGISQSYQWNTYPKLNLIASASNNDFVLGDLVAEVNSKYGLATDEICSNVHFKHYVRYSLDYSNIPQSAFPLTLSFSPSIKSNNAIRVKNVTYENNEILPTLNGHYNIVMNSNDDIMSFNVEYSAYESSGCLSIGVGSFVFIPPTVTIGDGSDIYYAAKGDFTDYLAQEQFIFMFRPELCSVNDFSDYLSLYASSMTLPFNFSCTGAYISPTFRFYPAANSSHSFEINESGTFTSQNFALKGGTDLVISSGKTVTFDSCNIFSANTLLWNSIIVEDSATLIMNKSFVEDGLHGIVVKPGGKLISDGTVYYSNRISITIDGDENNTDKHEFGDFKGNRFSSLFPSGFVYRNFNSYPRETYFYGAVDGFSGVNSFENAYCAIYVEDAHTELIGDKLDFSDSPNIISNMANGVISKKSKIFLENFSFEVMKGNAIENFDLKGNGVYTYKTYLYINGGQKYAGSSPEIDFNFDQCPIAINANLSYNNIIYFNKIKNSPQGIYIHQLGHNGATIGEDVIGLSKSLHLDDHLQSNEIESFVNAITIESLLNSYYNVSRGTYIDYNTLNSGLQNATGIVTDAFESRINNNSITLSAEVNGSLGQAAIQIHSKAAYLPTTLTPTSNGIVRSLRGTYIYENNIDVVSVVYGINAIGGRTNKIFMNDIDVITTRQEIGTKVSLIKATGGGYYISRNSINYGNTVSQNAQFPNSILLENAPRSLIGCNDIDLSYSQSGIHILGENGASTIRGNLLSSYETTLTPLAIEYGHDNQFDAVTGAQVHQGNLFYTDFQNSKVKYWHDTNDEYEKSKFEVNENHQYADPAIKDPTHGWFDTKPGTAFQCQILNKEDTRVLIYEDWLRGFRSVRYDQDSLYINRFGLEPSSTLPSYSSSNLFDSEFGLELLYQDSLINTSAFSTYEQSLVSQDLDLLYNVKRGFISGDDVSFSGEIQPSVIELQWNSEMSDSVSLNTHITDINTAFQNISTLGTNTSEPVLSEIEIRNILSDYYNNQSLSISNATKLSDLAFSCPYTYGNAVYYAQYLYNKVNSPINFNDIDLCSTSLSAMVSVVDKDSLDENLEVSPNPTTGLIYLNNGLDGSIEVYTITGQKVKKFLSLKNRKTIDISELKNGIYILHIIGEDSAIHISKIIKI